MINKNIVSFQVLQNTCQTVHMIFLFRSLKTLTFIILDKKETNKLLIISIVDFIFFM